MNLFLDTSGGQLLAAYGSSTAINPTSLGFYAGDGALAINLYFLALVVNPQQGQWPYSVILPSGLAGASVQIDNGQYGATLGQVGNPYTYQVDWTADPTNTFFTAIFPMNVAAITALFAGGVASVSAFLRIGYNLAGEWVTVFAQPITIRPGLPNSLAQVPTPLTPLSVEVAKALFVQIAGGAPGNGFFLVSPLGVKKWVSLVDDGTGNAQLEAS